LKRLAVIAGAAVALAAPAARAEDLFATFENVCLAAHGDGQAALAKADAAGWMPMPQALIKQLSAEDGFKDVKARIRSTDASLDMILVARMEGDIRKVSVSFQFCAVASLPPQPELKARLVDWSGVAPSPDMGGRGRIGFVFIEDGGRHTAVETNTSNTLKLIRDGRIRVTAVQDDKQMTMALYAIPTVNEKP